MEKRKVLPVIFEMLGNQNNLKHLQKKKKKKKDDKWDC